MNTITMFVLVVTVFVQGTGPVTTRSEPMDLASCHAQMTQRMNAAGSSLVSAHCDGVEIKQ